MILIIPFSVAVGLVRTSTDRGSLQRILSGRISPRLQAKEDCACHSRQESLQQVLSFVVGGLLDMLVALAVNGFAFKFSGGKLEKDHVGTSHVPRKLQIGGRLQAGSGCRSPSL